MTDEHRQLLKSRLKANRWNLYHLATYSGITPGYLSRMLHNRLDASQPIKIALALHASMLTDFPYSPSDFDTTSTTTDN
jgi:transcriptional regulator with XRE-family HTH domain